MAEPMAIPRRVGVAVVMILCTPLVVVWWLGLAVAVACGQFVPWRDGWTVGIHARDEAR